MSDSSLDDVNRITGIALVFGSSLISFKTCSPSTLGSFKSSKTSRGRSSPPRAECSPRRNRKSSASAPSRARITRLATVHFFSACSASSASDGLSSTSRISTARVSGRFDLRGLRFVRWLRQRSQREKKGSSGIQLRFGPDFAAVPANDPLHGNQANPRSFEVLLPMQPLEHSKELIGISRIEPHSVVAHKNRQLAIGRPRTHFNHRRRLFSGELHGVRQQISKH